MKKILFFIMTTVFLGSAVAVAGEACEKCKCSSEKYIEKKVEKLQKALNLEDSQLPQVEAILKTKMESKKAIHDRMEQEMTAVSQTFQANMNQILNSDQQVALQKMMDEYNEKKKCADSKKCKKPKRFFLFKEMCSVV